jgi:hypothetical protein
MEVGQSSAMSSTRQTTPRHSPTEQSSSRPPTTRLGNVRAGVQGLFTGISTIGRARSHSQDSPESPKSPRHPVSRPIIGLQDLPTPRFNIPYLSRSHSSRSQRSHRSNHSQSSIAPLSPHTAENPYSTQPITPNYIRQQTEHPNVHAVPRRVRHTSDRRFDGVDPAELALAELVHNGRRRRRNKPRNSRGGDRRCTPRIKNKRIRSKILSCFISGLVIHIPCFYHNGMLTLLSSLLSFSPSILAWLSPIKMSPRSSMSC